MVFTSAYLQAMDRASQDGLILIEGSGPTYATATVSLSGAAFYA